MSSTGELLQKLQEGGGDEALRGLYALDGSDASLEKGPGAGGPGGPSL